MLTATCNISDTFYEKACSAVMPEFAEWCDASRRIREGR